MQLGLLEDDLELGSYITKVMARAGHQAKHYRDARSMLRALRQDSFDLLLLDWSLPVSSGLEVLRWTREHLNPPTPAIMITARAGEADIITGLTSGADDYLAKPINDNVLTARVEALLRRTYGRQTQKSVECFDEYAFDIKKQTITMAGHAVFVTAKEFDLALLLFRNLQRPLSRNYIFETVWANAPGALSRTLDSHISQIRQRLKLRPVNGWRLSSVYAFGYRLERFETRKALATSETEATVVGANIQ